MAASIISDDENIINSENSLQKSYFDVLGICCSSEVPLVEGILKTLNGVQDVSVIVPTKTVVVLHDSLLTSQSEIVKALNKAKLEAAVRTKRAKNSKKKWPSPFTIASGVLLVLSFLKYVYLPFQWLALGAVGVVIFPIALRAFTALRHLTFGNINILVVIAAVGSIALKDYWEAGTIVFLFKIAEWLVSLASQKATEAMSSLVNLLPQRAVLAETGEEVDVSEVEVNTVLSVKEGEMVPIDGVVIEGNCEVDEKSLSGESFPVAKQKDSTVWAGTINMNGYISIRTTTRAENCVLARMTKLVEEAQGKRSQIERYIDKFTKFYTPAIVVISASVAIFPAALRLQNQKEWFHIALVVLVSACPCALILSTPVAMFCALTKAAKSGVLFKGADYLETLARVKIMAFDKTGTITRAEFEVTEFRSLSDDISLSTMLYWVSSIQSKSSHPIAAALVDFAQSHSVEPKPEKVEQYHNFPGEGIYGRIDGKEIYIGNLRISSRVGCNLVPKLEGNMHKGKSVGYIFLGSTPAGIFCLADVCRTGAKEALKELKSMGIKNVMLTGDCYAAAKHTEDQLGGALEVVRAELLPEEKATIIKYFQKLGSTAMIGDGINDAPALATADIGISMGISGSALATETGHVILMTNDIQRIPKVARLARRVRRKVLENMILSVATKGSVLALAIAGHPLLWAAVLVDVGTCLLVILSSMLLLRDTPKAPTKCSKSSAASYAKEDNGKCSGSDLSQTQKQCCSVVKPPKCCEIRTCLDSKRSGSNEKKSCCGNGGQSPEAKCYNPGEVNCEECQDKSSGIDLPNAHQPCCYEEKQQISFKAQTCSSKYYAPRCQSSASSSCGSIQSSDSNDRHSCCGSKNQIQGSKCCSGDGCCNNDYEPIRLVTDQYRETSINRSKQPFTADEVLGKVFKSCCSYDPESNIKFCKNDATDCGSLETPLLMKF